MNLESIDNELKVLGYISFLKETESEQWIVGGIADEITTLKVDSAFQVRLSNGGIQVSYLKRHTVLTKVFESNKEVLEYIKEKFPFNE